MCGFDILRTKKTSYVCDVNGFSLVKKNVKYYDNCARVLREIIMGHFTGEKAKTPICRSISTKKYLTVPPEQPGRELKCVVAIMRHSDRTPKQKVKMIVTNSLIRDVFNKYGGKKKGAVKLKVPGGINRAISDSSKM